MRKLLPTLAAVAISSALLVGCSTADETTPETKEKPTWSATPPGADPTEGEGDSETDPEETEAPDDAETDPTLNEDPFKDLKEYKKDGKTLVDKGGVVFEVEKDSKGEKTYKEHRETKKDGRVEVEIPKFEGMSGKEVSDYLKKYNVEDYGVYVQYIDMDSRERIDQKEVYKYSVCETTMGNMVGKKMSFGAEEYIQFFMKITC